VESQDTSPRKKRVLILGDWVVDDYWMMGIHRSPTASRTGRKHYRSLHPLKGSVRTLCGAGRTASVLYDAQLPQTNRVEILGVGMWHLSDDDAISQLLDPPTIEGANPYSLSSGPPSTKMCASLTNLARPLSEFVNAGAAQKLPHSGDYQGVGTTRMIRIFQNTGTRIELLERIDWELPAPFNHRENVHAWFPDPELYRNDTSNELYRAAATDLLARLPSMSFGDIDAVVIKDLGKGCVSSSTVQWLKNQVSASVPWFVSSKSWLPTWFSHLPRKSLALLMVPQVAARIAVERGEVRRWLTQSGAPTLETIKWVDRLQQKYGAETLVILPDEQQVVSFSRNEPNCHVQRLQRPIDLDFEVAMASVFLPAFLLNGFANPNGQWGSKDAKAAASFTDEWMKREVERIAAAEETHPPSRLIWNSERVHEQSGEWNDVPLSDEGRRWEKALADFGVLEDHENASIELSRSMTTLDGYVCLVSHKQDVVQQLLRETRRFVHSHEPRHTSLLMTAKPGSGKSALIDALALAERLSSYTINVAQLPGRIGIIDEFDTVATLQSQNRGAPLLVFVDEINSMLESQHVYDLFLSPMQSGEYVRDGNRFRLDPCLWIFVGSAKPTEDNKNPATKAKDFESRLTVSQLSLDTDDQTGVRLERVYLGVAILTAHFPDVRKVTKKVLRMFHLLPNACTLRDMVKLISSFENVQLGKVHSGNVPKSSFHEIENLQTFDFGDWEGHDEEGFIKIVGSTSRGTAVQRIPRSRPTNG
jgi:hypothetical protein